MDELLDVVDENDRPTGIRKSKRAIHRDGDFHRAAHMWIYSDRGEILFQLRSNTKDIFPGLWDITGGHVGAGESYLETAVRELEEELGVSVSPDKLEPLYIQKDRAVHQEFQYVYLLQLNQAAETFRLQEEEVLEARFFGIEDLKSRLIDGQDRQAFCPVYDYYLNVIDIIEKRLRTYR